MPNYIPLTTLQDVLDVESDADFEQILAEIGNDLRALRARARLSGHGGISWPIRWRRSGPPSTITTHCTDGSLLPSALTS